MEKIGNPSSVTEGQFNEAAAHELGFWQEFVKTDRFLKGWCSNEKTPELNPMVHAFIVAEQERVGEGFRVLDVGSGVVSILHGTCPNLVAVDPLGDHYATIFDYAAHGLTQPQSASAEALPFVDEFDAVHCSNALDHTQDSFQAYGALLRAVKPDGYLIVQGFENEGVYEKYAGFHQWNISITRDGALKIEDKHGNFHKYTTDKNTGTAVRVQLDSGKYWFIWILKK